MYRLHLFESDFKKKTNRQKYMSQLLIYSKLKT